MARKGAELVPLMLRLPQSLRQKIEKRADQNRHSLNTEVIHMLESALQKDQTYELMQQVAQAAAEATASIHSGGSPQPIRAAQSNEAYKITTLPPKLEGDR